MDIKIEKAGRRDIDGKDVFRVATYKSAIDIEGKEVKVVDTELYVSEDYILKEKEQLEARLAEINQKLTKLTEVKNAVIEEVR